MKETPIFEEVFKRLMQLPGFWVKLLIGGLLSFVPIINLFAFGYLYRMSRAVRQSGQATLPDWPALSDWPALFIDGLRFAVVWLSYWLLPVLLAGGVSWFLDWLSLDVLAYLFCLTAILFFNLLFSAALYRYHMRKDFKDLLNLGLILRMTCKELPRQIIPSVLFLGLFAWLLPLYGIAFFGGFGLLLTYTGLRYRSIEQSKTVSY